ncbi:MAG: hypothetical protein IEMM0003_0326 [bacterium]|nr:MAG: hypothetical protein IEMM0003_0326 [bacterium]
MSKVWINVVLSTGEILIGKISLPVNVSDDPVSDILDLFENDILWSIELENCHKVIKNEKDTLYQSITDLGFEANMIISLEHIISISILKDDSEILSRLKVIRKKIVKIRKSSKLLKLPNIPFNI